MPFNHFSKIFEKTTWLDVMDTKKLQIENDCKMMQYIELATITVAHEEFIEICNSIAHPHICYQRYAADSVTTLNGVWKCIIVMDELSYQMLIIYTGGRTYPLYAAI